MTDRMRDDIHGLSPDERRRLVDDMTREFSRRRPKQNPAPIVQPRLTRGIAYSGLLTETEYEMVEFTTGAGGVDIGRSLLYRNRTGAEALGLLAPDTPPFAVHPALVERADVAQGCAHSPVRYDRGQVAIRTPSADAVTSPGILGLQDILRDCAAVGATLYMATMIAVLIATIAA